MTEIYTLIWIITMLMLCCFFAGMEQAFITANRLSIELKKKQGKRPAMIISKFLDHPSRFLLTCLVGYYTCLVAYGLLFNELLREAVWYPVKIQNAYIKLIANTLVSALVAVFMGVFIPRVIFRAKSDPLLIFFARLMNVFYALLGSFVSFFLAVSRNMLDYLFNIKIKDKDEAFTKVDIDHFSREVSEQYEENKDLNSELFQNALALPTVKIRHCLIPRTEIESIDIDASVADAKKKFIETKLSKLVVYSENIDNIQGYIHQLALFQRPADIRSVLLPIFAVPESMGAMDLITKFSKERKSMAWVVDEFGGTAGIITLEDVLEKIFGEIKDEYDTEELLEKTISETEFEFSGRLELDYLNEKYNFTFPENESETLSGYIINEYEKIPKLNERIIIGRYEFDITNVSDTRIETTKMKVLL
jgi:CBS domain containing-hemolysin-like protein